MPPKVNARIANAPQLLIKVIAAETGALIAGGAPIINLSQGSPNAPPFPSALDAVRGVLDSAKLPYTAVAGTDDVRATCAAFLNRGVLDLDASSADCEGVYEASHVCVTNGAVQAVWNVLSLSVDGPDDVVVTPLPAYGLYLSDTALLGGTFAPLECGSEEDGFAFRAADVRRVFDTHGPRMRVLVLCAPNNPTGRCWTADEARDLAAELDAQLAAHPDYRFSVLLDEVYTGISSVEHVSLLRYASPALRRCCFFACSASKGLGGAPGARAGFVACADAELMTHLVKVQMAATANVSVLAQQLLRGSLEHVMAHGVADVNAFYEQRTRLVCERLAAYVRFPPQGTFYVVASAAGLGYATDVDVIRDLRDAYTRGEPHGVALVPLSAFAVPAEMCLVRICCAADLDVLDRACQVVCSVWGKRSGGGLKAQH